jgi:hypothetical protein
MRTKLLTALLAGSVALTGVAHANPTFTYTSYSVADGIGQSGATVNLYDPTLNVNIDAYAGQIDLHGSTTMATYCVDILDDLASTGTYNTGSPRTSMLTPTLINEISVLISNGGTNYTAIQLAIWTAEYGNNLSITGDSTDLAVATTDLGLVTSGTWKAPTTQALYELTPQSPTTNQNLGNCSPRPGERVPGSFG